jgi:hypothetical protein
MITAARSHIERRLAGSAASALTKGKSSGAPMSASCASGPQRYLRTRFDVRRASGVAPAALCNISRRPCSHCPTRCRQNLLYNGGTTAAQLAGRFCDGVCSAIRYGLSRRDAHGRLGNGCMRPAAAISQANRPAQSLSPCGGLADLAPKHEIAAAGAKSSVCMSTATATSGFSIAVSTSCRPLRTTGGKPAHASSRNRRLDARAVVFRGPELRVYDRDGAKLRRMSGKTTVLGSRQLIDMPSVC